MELNIWAILVSALASYILGTLWYSPLLFMKPWLRMNGMTKKEAREGMNGGVFFLGAIAAIMTALAFGVIYALIGVESALVGLAIAVIIWIGFTGAVSLNGVLYEKMPFALYVLHSGYTLVGFCIMGAIIGAW